MHYSMTEQLFGKGSISWTFPKENLPFMFKVYISAYILSIVARKFVCDFWHICSLLFLVSLPEYSFQICKSACILTRVGGLHVLRWTGGLHVSRWTRRLWHKLLLYTWSLINKLYLNQDCHLGQYYIYYLGSN